MQFTSNYDARVVIYERKMFIRLPQWSTKVNYDSRVVAHLKIPHITTLESEFMIVEP